MTGVELDADQQVWAEDVNEPYNWRGTDQLNISFGLGVAKGHQNRCLMMILLQEDLWILFNKISTDPIISFEGIQGLCVLTGVAWHRIRTSSQK